MLARSIRFDEIRSHWSQVENNNEDFKILELTIMTNEEFDEFKNDLLANWDFLDGKGGIDSTTVPVGIEGKPLWEWTEEERNEFLKGSYRECVGVTTAKAKEMVVVDPQGHNYARLICCRANELIDLKNNLEGRGLVMNVLAKQLAESMYYRNHFEQYGTTEDFNYYQGRFEAIAETALALGYNVEKIRSEAAKIEVQPIEVI